MRRNATNLHRGIAVSNDESVTYPAPILHGMKLQGQLNDKNELYEGIAQTLRNKDHSRGQEADKGSPHCMARQSFSWTRGRTVEVGLFASDSQYGFADEATYQPASKLHISCYADTEEAKKANTPAKVSVVLETRASGLRYSDGNQFTWPGGWDGETHIEGTFVQIQSSYGEDVWTVWCRAYELLNSFVETDWLASLYSQTVFETLRVGSLETHHRHHRDTLMAVNEVIGQAGSLFVYDGDDCSETVLYERGHSLLHRVQSSDFQLLGFQSEVRFTHDGRRFGVDLNDCAVKTYEHKGAKAVGADSPLAHPKTESVLLGWFPAPAFDALLEVSTTILHAFLAWGGVEREDLIEDEFYVPKDRPLVTTPVPTEYVEGLMSYYESESLRNTLIGELFHRRTMSKFDIVTSLLFWSRHSKHGSTGVTYQALSEKTGLAQETLRKHVRDLENLGVVKRVRSGRTFIAISRASRDLLKKLVLPSAQTVGDVLSKVKERATIRRAKREGSNKSEGLDSTTEDAGLDQLQEVEENWQYLAQTEYSPEEIIALIRAGRLSPKDILIRK